MGAGSEPGFLPAKAGANGGMLSGAALFAILWEALADLLGTAATATLLRRAARRAAFRCPELSRLLIVRERLEYSYSVDPAWSERQATVPLALRELLAELRPLLVEMTGQIVVRHLQQIPELSAALDVPSEEKP